MPRPRGPRGWPRPLSRRACRAPRRRRSWCSPSAGVFGRTESALVIATRARSMRPASVKRKHWNTRRSSRVLAFPIAKFRWKTASSRRGGVVIDAERRRSQVEAGHHRLSTRDVLLRQRASDHAAGLPRLGRERARQGQPQVDVVGARLDGGAALLHRIVGLAVGDELLDLRRRRRGPLRLRGGNRRHGRGRA